MASKKSFTAIDFKSLETEYGSISFLAEKFGTEVISQINNLLENTDIALGFPVQYRIKTFDSIVEKINRLKMPIKNVTDLQDFVGIRIITLLKQDALLVNKLIDSNFLILRQYDTQQRLKEDQFGYSSMHHVVKLKPSWLAVPSFAQMGNLSAEIQVRTVAQHIWAEASQKFQYKNETNVPLAIKRTIYRVSALLETVDLEFDRLVEERKTYRTSVNLSDTEEPLNVDLLEKILDSILPQQNKGSDENYSEMLNELTYFGIKSKRQLIALISKNLKKALDSDAARVEDEKGNLETEGEVYGTALERIEQGVFYIHTGLLREIMSLEFGSKFDDYLKSKSIE